jgi:nicotinamide mononucleotide adenylyltransferase
MCSLATELTSNWLMVDAWEGHQPRYQPTAVVLDHFDHQINEVLGGIQTSNGNFLVITLPVVLPQRTLM